MAAHLSAIRRTIDRNTIDITTVWAKIDLIVPYLITIDIWIDIPCYAMRVIHIDSAEIFQFDERLKHCTFFKVRSHII